MTQGQSQVNLLTIKQFAEICRTTPRTLRFYEKKGLFKPAVIDTFTKYRFYNPRQAREFLKIKLLQNFHVPLKQIKINSIETTLLNRLKVLKEEIQEKEKEYKFLEKMKTFLFKDDKIENVFHTRSFGPYNLFCMKVEHGEYPKIIDYLKTIWKEARRLGIRCYKSEMVFYLNYRYNPKNTPMEICLILKGKKIFNDNKKLPINFYFKKFPKTKILSYDYMGPHDYLIIVYQKLFTCIEENKIAFKNPVFDFYKSGPLNTKSKYDYQTLMGFPI